MYEGKHKIADKFEEEIYDVEEHVANLPIYKVNGQSGVLKTLPRNLFFYGKTSEKFFRMRMWIR